MNIVHIYPDTFVEDKQVKDMTVDQLKEFITDRRLSHREDVVLVGVKCTTEYDMRIHK